MNPDRRPSTLHRIRNLLKTLDHIASRLLLLSSRIDLLPPEWLDASWQALVWLQGIRMALAVCSVLPFSVVLEQILHRLQQMAGGRGHIPDVPPDPRVDLLVVVIVQPADISAYAVTVPLSAPRPPLRPAAAGRPVPEARPAPAGSRGWPATVRRPRLRSCRTRR